jgi:TRAP-type mannitol/chloroaromatic compound transport system permease large subunit
VPGIPTESRTVTGWSLIKRCLWGIIPSVVLIFLVLGTIFLGLATPTEAGAMGMVGAIVLAVLHREEFSRHGKIAAWIALVAISVISVLAAISSAEESMPSGLVAAVTGFYATTRIPLFIVFYAGLAVLLWEAVVIGELRGLIAQASRMTMRITSMAIFILIGSTIFTLVFRGVDGDLWIEHLLLALPGGKVGFLVFVNVFVFFLAFFLDFFEIAFIVVPMLAPVAAKLGIDLVWFGVLLCVNIQTSFMHPPFGFALFYLRGIAPREVKSSAIYWGAIPWVVVQVVMVGIVIAWPGLVTALVDKGTGVDPATIEIQLPQNDYGTARNPASDAAADAPHGQKEENVDGAEKAGKSAEEQSAEDIEKAFRQSK